MAFLNVFAVIIVVLVFGFFGLVVLKITIVSQAAHDVMLILIGALAGALSIVLNFFFGSSKSSADKNTTINKMLGTDEPKPDKEPNVI
jgi:hypothetical protein